MKNRNVVAIIILFFFVLLLLEMHLLTVVLELFPSNVF